MSHWAVFLALLVIIAALGCIIITMKVKLDAQEIGISMLRAAYHDTNSLLEALTEAHKAPNHEANKNPNKFSLEDA